jgi:hypothetical protein
MLQTANPDPCLSARIVTCSMHCQWTHLLPCAAPAQAPHLPCCAVPFASWLQVVHDTNGATSVSDLTLIDVNTPQVGAANCNFQP